MEERLRMKRRNAVVIGAGFAGLRIACVLANHFESVTIIEKRTIREKKNLQLLLSIQNLSRLQIRENCTVAGLIPSIDQQRILGVVTLCEKSDIMKLRHADFVIDASGKTSCAPKWLQELGYRQSVENLKQWPDRFLVLGDALRTLKANANAGTDNCEAQVSVLDSTLRSSQDLDGLSIQLQKQFVEVISQPRPTGLSGFAERNP
jgi:hypothetical protein